MNKEHNGYLIENNSDFTWSTIRNLLEKDIKERDKLDFYNKAKRELDIITNNKFNNGNSLFIEGPWGSGKSTFINVLLWHFQNKFTQDKFIPIFFDPWYIIDSKTFFESYFQTIKKTLLSYKYSEKLSNSIDGFLGLLDGLETPILKNLKNIFINKGLKSSIREQINEIIQVINNEYGEYTICIVIDEIDRLSRDNLHELSKILDISKQLADYCKQIYLIMGWDSTFLNKIIIAGQQIGYFDNNTNYSKPISMSKYLEKFQNRRISIYKIDKIVKNIRAIILSLSTGNQSQLSKGIELNNLIEEALRDLREKDIIVNIRKLYQIDIALHYLKSYFAKENEEISEISINSILNPFDIVFTIYLQLLIRDNPSILYDLHSYFELNNWYENSKDDGEFKKTTEKLGIRFEILETTNNKRFSNYNYLKRIVSIIGNETLNISTMKLQGIYSLISSHIKEKKLEDAKALTIKYKNHIFEGKDDWSAGPNGLSFIWRNLNQEVKHETYNTIFEYLNIVIHNEEIINYINGDYNILNETIDDITHIIAHYYEYYQGSKENEIEREGITKGQSLLFNFIFYYWLYSLSIAKNNSGYNEFENNLRKTRDKNIIKTNIDINGLSADFAENYQGSKYLGIKWIEVINKIIQTSHNGIIDLRFQNIKPKIEEIEIIYICRRIISLFQNDKLLDSSITEIFIEKHISKKTQLQLLFAIVERDELRIAQTQYIISSEMYSREIIENRLKLVNDKELLDNTRIYIFQNINSIIKLQTIDKKKEEIDKIINAIKLKYGIKD